MYPCVPDVLRAFSAINRRGVEFRCRTARLLPGEYDNWGNYNHFQGVQRFHCGKFLAVSGSGDNFSHLFIIEMRSRSQVGPWGSNLTSQPENLPGHDKLVKVVNIDGQLKHAGGFQIVGHNIAIGIEEDSVSRIVFFDVSYPLSPQKIYELDRSSLPPVQGKPPAAGAVAISKEPDGKYLMIVGRGNSDVLDFYRSRNTNLYQPDFDFLTSWTQDDLQSENNMDQEFGNYQNINLVQQCDGSQFLVGLHRNNNVGGVLPGGRDYADLFRIGFLDSHTPIITKIANKHMICDGCNLDAGGGVFIDINGRMIIYGVEHWADGPRISFNEFS